MRQLYLGGQLAEAGWKILREEASKSKQRTPILRVHCHGVFGLSGGQDVLVIVGIAAPGPGSWLPHGAWVAARDLLTEQQRKEAEFNEELERKKQENATLFSSSVRETADLVMETLAVRPVLTGERLVPHLPVAATFSASRTSSPERIERAAISAIVRSGWAPSRDGAYSGLLYVPMGREHIGVAVWSPWTQLPPYPEVRWTVQRHLPRAILKPRLTHVSEPEIDEKVAGTPEKAGPVMGVDAGDTGTDPFDSAENLQLDDSDFRQRVAEIRGSLGAEGLEAIAWFQPYHSWTEETWGIYFDAPKLDAFALSFLDDFRTRRISGSQADAARLAFGLTYAHELFHARVEASLSWIEVNAVQPRYLRYKRRVYDVVKGTDNWLEEALANWSAWDWYRSQGTQATFGRLTGSVDRLHSVVEASLDLSPPGYREWRRGNSVAAWRIFATQLSTGRPKASAAGLPLPLESILRSSPPYDLQPSDIPLRFVGRGAIANHLQAHPASFNVPSRRELERALKYLGHRVDPSGGKGSHQKWTSSDQRAFILPTRDPVSVGVFKTFLQHVGIDKARYVREVRPNL
jgi:hypothetical protein